MQRQIKRFKSPDPPSPTLADSDRHIQNSKCVELQRQWTFTANQTNIQEQERVSRSPPFSFGREGGNKAALKEKGKMTPQFANYATELREEPPVVGIRQSSRTSICEVDHRAPHAAFTESPADVSGKQKNPLSSTT